MTEVDRVAPEELVERHYEVPDEFGPPGRSTRCFTCPTNWPCDAYRAAQYITRLEGTITRNNREAGDALADAETRRSHAEQEVKRLEGENERLRTGRDQAIIALDRGAEYERMARSALSNSTKEDEDETDQPNF